MVTSFRRSRALSAPTRQQATVDPRLCPSLGQSLVGALLLSPGSWCTQGSASQACVSSGGSTAGLKATSSKRAFATPRSAAARTPALQQATADPALRRRRPDTVLAQSLWSLWFLVYTSLLDPSEHLWRVRGLVLNAISPLLPSCWGFSSALGRGVSFLVGSNILQWTVVQQRVVVLEFLQEKRAHFLLILHLMPQKVVSSSHQVCGNLQAGLGN